VPTDRLAKHLHSHKFLNQTLGDVQHHVAQVIQNFSLPVAQTAPVVPDQVPCPPVEMLPVSDGLLCRLCPRYAAGTPATMEKHFRQEHSNIPSQNRAKHIAPGKYQTIFSDQLRKLFPVHESPSLPVDDPYRLFLESPLAELTLDPAAPVTERDVPPLLRETEWHILLEGHADSTTGRTSVRGLVARPDKKEPLISLIHEHVKAWMSGIHDDAAKLSIAVRRCFTEWPVSVLPLLVSHFPLLIRSSQCHPYQALASSQESRFHPPVFCGCHSTRVGSRSYR